MSTEASLNAGHIKSTHLLSLNHSQEEKPSESKKPIPLKPWEKAVDPVMPISETLHVESLSLGETT